MFLIRVRPALGFAPATPFTAMLRARRKFSSEGRKEVSEPNILRCPYVMADSNSPRLPFPESR